MEKVDNEEYVTGSDNNRGDNEDREEEYGQLGVDSGQVRKVSSELVINKKRSFCVKLWLQKNEVWKVGIDDIWAKCVFIFL